MRREANIPLFLWITTAVVVHLLWSGGADRGARILEQRLDIQNFARTVQNRARGIGKPIEIALQDDDTKDEEEKPIEKDDPAKPDEVKAPEQQAADKDDPAAKKKPPEKEIVKPEQLVPKPEEKKPEPPKPEQKKAEPKPAPAVPPPPELTIPKKIAVKQVTEENQPDNPNAAFIADQANHVLQETQARITSADQNDAKPTPGGEHSSADKAPGDSDNTRVLQAEDKPGAQHNAPSEKPASEADKLAALRPPSASEAAHQRSTAPAQTEQGARTGSDKSQTTASAQDGQKAQAASKEADEIPESMTASNGGFTVSGPRQAFVDQAEAKARQARPLPKRRSAGDALLGFGSTGTTSNGVNLNLAPRTAVAAIGEDQLRRERLVDGERRRSAHLGSWHPMDPSRWKSAIENYVPSVKPGNQTALNTARSAFAGYLNGIHNRIHPLFADEFLSSLDSLPASHPMNNQDLSTELEIILDQDSGNVVRMGVTKFSGVTAFDIAALDAVKRAAPFGTPPREIVSPDGRVYLHWEFHRNAEACSTFNARPFILKAQPGSAPTEVTPPAAPSDPTEAPAPERHGENAPATRRRAAFAQN
ncbi:MAG: TonB C-terminal domain-containing protein [Polyangiaceae bacterium]